MKSSPVGRPRTAGRRDLPNNLVPRPRKSKDGRVVVYWYWRDPRDGQEKPLKCPDDRPTAIRRATELNALVAQEMADRVISDLSTAPASSLPRGVSRAVMRSSPFDVFAVHYLSQAKKRGLAENTLRTRKSLVNAAIRHFSNRPMHEIGVPDVVQLLKVYTDQNKNRLAQSLRSVLIDIWKEAYQAGLLPTDLPNPADIARRPTAKVRRAKLTLESFNAILESAKTLGLKRGAWVPNRLLLALVTGQRREDLLIAQFRRGRDWNGAWERYQEERDRSGQRDKGKPAQHPYPYVETGFFWVIQQKNGALVKIPLDLRLDALGMSVGDVIEGCRSKVASRYLLHHTKPFGNAPRGNRISIERLSHAFADARDRTGLKWPGKTPPTFHEIRSLSERLYKAQGVDTLALLGHRHARMIEVYADPRQAEWTTVAR